MDTSRLLLIDDGRMQKTEEVDESKFHVKELRIKDLHKNLCKRLHTHIGYDSQTTTCVVEASQPDFKKPKKTRRLKESSEYGTCGKADNFLATQLCLLHSPLDCGQGQAPQPSLQNRPCLRDDSQRDVKSNRLIHEESFRSCKGDGAKLKFQYSCLPFKSQDVESRRSRRQLYEDAVGSRPVDAPVMQHEIEESSDDDATSGERLDLDSSDCSDLSIHSSSERGMPLKYPDCFATPAKQSFTIPERSGVSFDYKECLEDITDSETSEGGDQIPESKKNLGSRSPKVIVENILPMKWRYASTEGGMGEAVPAVKIGKTLDTKKNENRGRIIRSRLKHDKGKTIRSKSKQSDNPPDPNKEKSGLIVKSRTPSGDVKHGYTSKDTSDVLGFDFETGFKYNPIFTVKMIHSSVTNGYWLRCPAEFACKHMPDHDDVVVLQDAARGLKWDANYLAKKKSFSAGWRRFAKDHGLKLGHVVVFELIKPLKFLVHIVINKEPLSQKASKWPKA